MSSCILVWHFDTETKLTDLILNDYKTGLLQSPYAILNLSDRIEKPNVSVLLSSFKKLIIIIFLKIQNYFFIFRDH